MSQVDDTEASSDDSETAPGDETGWYYEYMKPSEACDSGIGSLIEISSSTLRRCNHRPAQRPLQLKLCLIIFRDRLQIRTPGLFQRPQ